MHVGRGRKVESVTFVGAKKSERERRQRGPRSVNAVDVLPHLFEQGGVWGGGGGVGRDGRELVTEKANLGFTTWRTSLPSICWIRLCAPPHRMLEAPSGQRDQEQARELG